MLEVINEIDLNIGKENAGRYLNEVKLGRSIRNFTEQKVGQQLIEKLLAIWKY